MRRGLLILAGLCVAAAAAAAGGWYYLHSGDPMAQARSLIQKGDDRGAQLVLRDLLRRRPDLPEAHLRLALIQLRGGDPIAAEHELREALSHGADEHAVRPLLAQALAGQKQAAVVLRDYDDSGLDPAQSTDLHIARVSAALQLKQFSVARAEVAAAQAASPRSVEASLDRARVEGAAGDLGAALTALDQTLALDAHTYAALSMRARILAQQGKIDDAIAAFGVAFADPSSKANSLTADQLTRANLYLAKGADAAARRDVDAALKTVPTAPFGNYLLATLNARAGQWRAADEALTAVGPVIANFPRGDVLVALVKMNIGQPEQALDAAEHFNSHNPQDVAGARLLATVEIGMGRAPAAIQLLTPWAAATPPDPGILAVLSEAYAATGRAADAQATLRKAADTSQGNAAALARIGSLAVREGNPTLGSEVYQAVLNAGTPAAAGNTSAANVSNPPNVPNGPAGGATPGRADTAAALVVASLRAGQLDRAAAALDTLRAAHGDPKQVDLLTGALKLAQFDLAGARAAFESARARDPQAPEIVSDLARVMVLQGETDAAATLLRDALGKQPGNQTLVGAFVDLSSSRGRIADAIPVVEAAHAAAPDTAPFAVLLSALYLQARQTDKALALANSLPADTPLQLGLRADAQRGLGNEDEAFNLWQALLAKTPQDIVLRRRIASLLLQDGREAMAATVLDQGLEAHPADPGLQFDAVALTERREGLPAALSRADAFAARTGSLASQLLKGDLLMANRKFTEAATAYGQARTAPANKPEDAEALTTRQAGALLAAGDGDGSTKLLSEWLRTHPDSYTAVEMLAEADIAAGRLPDARTKLDTVLQHRPNDPTALNNLAWVVQQGGDFAKSQTLASQAYALAPSPQTADTLGWALFNLGKGTDSVPLLRQAALGQAGDPTVQYHYAAALGKAGQKDAAKAMLKPLLDGNTVFKERADAQQLMRSLGGS